jgi:hypothetical protein
MTESIKVFLPKREAKYFCEQGWTRWSQKRPSGKSVGPLSNFERQLAARNCSSLALYLSNALASSLAARRFTFLRNARSWRCIGEPSGPNIFAARLAYVQNAQFL